MVVETTGLADPAPILYTLLSEPVVKHHFVPETVVVTVDAQHGLRHPESVKQAAAADRIVVTKVDLADPAELELRLARLNPTAEIVEAAFGDVDPSRLFVRGPGPLTKVADEPSDRHEAHAVCLAFEEQLDWTAFGIWLTMLLQARGEEVLRVKGLLDVGGPGPLVLNGVQHVIHPPVHLDSWPDEDRRSRIVFIGRGLERAAVKRSLLAFNGAAP